MADTKTEKFPKITVKSSIAKPGSKKSLTVKGVTLDELRTNLNKHDHWGEYVCNANMGYKNDGKKRIVEVSVSAKPDIYMPVWSDYSKASKDDKKAWDDMYAKLLKHETNHHYLALEVFAIFLQEVEVQNAQAEATNKAVEKEKDPKKKEKLLAGFKPWTVTTLKARLKTLGTDLQKVQDDYDKKTNHGQKEGVKI